MKFWRSIGFRQFRSCIVKISIASMNTCGNKGGATQQVHQVNKNPCEKREFSLVGENVRQC
jgi:hypothetical protein